MKKLRKALRMEIPGPALSSKSLPLPSHISSTMSVSAIQPFTAISAIAILPYHRRYFSIEWEYRGLKK